MSDTPRTDAEVVRGGEFLPTPVQFLCRQLERELAAVTKERDEAKELADRFDDVLCKLVVRARSSLASAGIPEGELSARIEAACARIKRLEDLLVNVINPKDPDFSITPSLSDEIREALWGRNFTEQTKEAKP